MANDITTPEAIEVLKLGEGYSEQYHDKYQLGRKTDNEQFPFSELYYVYQPTEGEPEKVVCAIFSDSRNAVMLHKGNSNYRTHYRIIKYLEKQNFDLAAFDQK